MMKLRKKDLKDLCRGVEWAKPVWKVPEGQFVETCEKCLILPNVFIKDVYNGEYFCRHKFAEFFPEWVKTALQ